MAHTCTSQLLLYKDLEKSMMYTDACCCYHWVYVLCQPTCHTRVAGYMHVYMQDWFYLCIHVLTYYNYVYSKCVVRSNFCVTNFGKEYSYTVELFYDSHCVRQPPL